MNWPKTLINTSHGARQAISPLIISASRATDIPAFYMPWLMRRLRTGYCAWMNPFNRVRQYISFCDCKFIVFWSKNPAPVIPYLEELRDRGLDLYIQFTLNDYEAEGLESGLPSLGRRLNTFARLSELLGRERVLWRFDPLLLGMNLSVGTLLERICRLAEILQYVTDTLTFSFIDIAPYARLRTRMRKYFPAIREPDNEEILRLIEGITVCNASLRMPLVLASCAESIPFSCGIRAASCVDAKRIETLCPGTTAALPDKDAGQRAACGCAPSKDIGAYGTCPHACAYCYANISESASRARLASHDEMSESL